MRPYATLLIALLLLSPAVGPAGCSRDDGAAGVYEASLGDGKNVELTLEKSGKGSWTVGADTIVFRWSRENGTVLLHTRAGGVVAAEPAPGGGGLLMDLPGVGELAFVRQE